MPHPSEVTQGKDFTHIVQEAGCVPGPVSMDAETVQLVASHC
jgi:hypothetical protein